MTSIKDVAREVHMSTATVSRALRGLPGVSPDTRARVMETALRLGYVASPSAAGLASGQTRTVAVVVPSVTQWFFSSVVHAAEEVLRAHGYDLLLYNLAGDHAARHRVFQTHLLRKRVDAVLILALTPTVEEQQWLDRLGLPGAVIGSEVPGWTSIGIDDEQAARTAAGHLLDLGHRRIAYVGGATEGVLDFTAPVDRRRGYRYALAAAGVEPDRDLEIASDFTVTGGYEAGTVLLGRRPRPTAVFAASDEMAIGVLRAARTLQLRVPEDVSVIGVDDHDMAAFFDLSTVAQPVHEQGRLAARAVLAALELGHAGRAHPTGGEVLPDRIVLPTRLVPRGSTAAAPSSA